MNAETVAGLVAVGVIAGLDLASVLQGLLSRPIVVGAATGLVTGDVENGLRIGALLELFALDVIPVGASRYPDFGAATVAAVLMGAGTSWRVTSGAAVGLGLVFAMLAGTTIPAMRRLNARSVRARLAAIERGDDGVLASVHLACLGHDLVRSLGLALAAVAVGVLVRDPLAGLDPTAGAWLTVVALAGGVWATAHGAMTSARSGPRWRWAAAGLVSGVVVALA